MKLKCRKNNEPGYHPFFIVMMILLVHILIFYKYHDLILHQITLRDFDGYWHLVRVKDLYHFGNTYHTTLFRSNAPYGENLHWTSAFDFMLYAGAYIGSFFVDFNIALLWVSIILNPFLHALTFLALFWGLRDLIGDLRASIFGVFFPFQLYLYGVFDMGVPDHHGVQMFIFSLFIALSIKSILCDSRKIFLFSGIAGGLSIWLGIECILVVLIAISFFGLTWILEGKTYQSKNLLFSLMLLLTTFLTMVIDTRYGELMKIVYDRPSIVHVFLFLTTTSFWVLVALVSKWSNVLEKKNARIIAATIGATACIFLLHELFPLFLKNPLSEVHPVIKFIYLNQTNEFTGLFSGNHLHEEIAYVYWAMTLPAVPISIFLAKNHQAKERKIWLFIALMNIFYILLSAFIFRMITYATLCALIPLSYAISHFFIFINNKVRYPYHRIARTLFILTCGFSFLIPALMFNSKKPEYLISDTKFLSHLCQYLNDNPYFQKKPRRILTCINFGPLLLYKTPHEVIGTPSHRNVSGILDTYYIMNAQKEDEAHKIILRRGIQVIIIGRPEYGIGDYFIDNSKELDKIFHHQLWKGNIPSWLQTYPVPKNLEGKIKVFRVTG